MAKLDATPTLSTTFFSLYSNWTYSYSSTSNGQYTYTKTQGPSTAAQTITANLDSLPSNAKITSAKLTWTASATSGTGGQDTGRGQVVPNGQSDASVFISAGTADFTNYILPGQENNFRFIYAPTVSSSYTTGVQASQITGSSTLNIYSIALIIEYQSGSVIYHAENGVLVPYQLFHAENGELVPYQIQHGEGEELVPY